VYELRYVRCGALWENEETVMHEGNGNMRRESSWEGN
jgi:hypothetical protein